MNLLRAYPAEWRERYGDELASLIEADSGGGRISLRVRLDVIHAGLVQRLGGFGPPEARIRAGVLLVLEAWAVFVVAGLAFAKTAEQAKPTTAYDVVLLAAELGTLAVLLGVVLTVRPLVAFLRAGGWRKIHRPVLRATAVTGLTAIVLFVVVAWAHQLTNVQRNGGDRLYSAAFVVLFVCVVASIGLWTRAAVVTARHLPLARASLRREGFLAAATTLTMAVMTLAATIWWTSVYGGPSVRMVAITGVMLAATALAGAGTLRALRA